MRHFEHRIGAKTVGVVAVLVAGGDHQEAEADDIGESVRDLIWRTLVLDTACETIGCSTSRSIKTPPSDDNKLPSNFATTDLPETDDRPGSGSIELIMADVVSQKRLGSASTAESYAKSPACATSANPRCIIRAKSGLT